MTVAAARAALPCLGAAEFYEALGLGDIWDTDIDRLTRRVAGLACAPPSSAMALSIRGHAKQERCTGEPSVCHPLRVTLAFAAMLGPCCGVRDATTAVLHDFVEDSQLAEAGSWAAIHKSLLSLPSSDRATCRCAIRALSKPEGATERRFHEQLVALFGTQWPAASVAAAVRLGDTIDNGATLVGLPPQRRVAYVHSARQLVPALCRFHPTTARLLDTLLANTLRAWQVAQ